MDRHSKISIETWIHELKVQWRQKHQLAWIIAQKQVWRRGYMNPKEHY